MSSKYLRRLVVGWAVLLALTGCATGEFVDTPQPRADTFLPSPVGQSFLAQHAGLEAVDVYLAPADTQNGPVTLHLRADSTATTDIATATIDSSRVTAPGFYRFSFAPVRDSHSELFYVFLTGENVRVGGSRQDAYPQGTAYTAGGPQRNDVALRLAYDTRTMIADLAGYAIHMLQTVLVGMYLYILPGLALFLWLWRGQHLTWPEYAGLAAGLSLALYPLILLWTHVLGVAVGPLLAIVPGGLALVYLLWRYRRDAGSLVHRIRTAHYDSHMLPELVLVSVLGIMLVTRLLPIRTMVAPAWGDSYQHTVIVQLLLDNGGLFQSWRPYAPMQSFTYHYGFHIAVAAWVWLTGMSAPQAVIVAGQVLNVLAAFALYPLTLRLSSGNRWAGVGAVVVAGLLSSMPAFYVNWGRYTQLAGQVVLPAVLWCLDVWWDDEERPPLHTLALLLLLLAGLALTHYRVLVIAASAVAAWALWGYWRLRTTPREWVTRAVLFGGTSALALTLIVPWLINVRDGRLATVQTAVAQRSVDNTALWQDLQIWRTTFQHYSRILVVAGIGSAALAAWKRRRIFVLIALWCLFAFVATNPFLLRLPGTGLVANFTLVVALYIPLALLLGWLIGTVSGWLIERALGHVVVAGILLLISAAGMRQQMHILDPFYQMMTPADSVAFDWIEDNTPKDATFLVNEFLAFGDTAVVGSDAGWWLPYYTLRDNTVPPLPYMLERMPSVEQREEIRQLEIAVRQSNGDPSALSAALCNNSVTHVYLGQRRGRVGIGATPLIREAWLRDDDAFSLLYQQNNAQVWSFDRSSCQ